MHDGEAQGWQKVLRPAAALGRLFIPNLGTLLLVGLLFWAQQAGALGGRPQGIAPNVLPGIITYQGKLTDKAGNPITGNLRMTFALYNVPTGGTALWSETYDGANAVPVQDGEFTVRLGSVNPLPADIWEQHSLYLGIAIGSDSEMEPREVIDAVPAAMQSSMAFTVPDGAIGSRQMKPTIFQAQLSGEVEVPPGGPHVVLEMTVDFPTDATYVFFIVLVSRHDEAGHRVQVALQDSSGNPISGFIHNSHPVAGLNGTQTGTQVAVHDLRAGPHTLRLAAWNDSSTSSGYVRRWSQIIAIPFAQVP